MSSIYHQVPGIKLHQNTNQNAIPTKPNKPHETPLLLTAADFGVPVPLTNAVVAFVKITSVVPEITVVLPFNDTRGSTGTVVGPEKISYSDPEIVVI